DEDRVADLFRLEPLAREDREKLVLGIGCGDLFAAVRGLPIGGGEQNLAVQAFDAPAVLHEIIGEIIEEFLIARLVAGLAEVADGRDDALAEILVPDAIDEDARRQGIALADEPI